MVKIQTPMINNRTFYKLSEPTNLRIPNLPDWVYLMIVATLAGMTIIISQIIGGIALVASYGLNVVETLSSGAPMSPGLLTTVLITGFLPIFFIVWFWLWLLEKRGLASVGMGLKGALRNYLRGLLVGLLMFGGAVAVMSLLGFTEIENPFSGASTSAAFMVLIGWIVQGAGEEVVTRGFLLQIFGRTTNTLTGILVSALIFTAFHALNANTGWLPFLNLFLFGVFAALYTLWEGGLWGIFAIHSIWNWAQGNLFGFEVSGNVIESGIILDLAETGPDIITGGLFGPEGGLAVTLVLLIGMALVWRSDRQRNIESPHI